MLPGFSCLVSHTVRARITFPAAPTACFKNHQGENPIPCRSSTEGLGEGDVRETRLGRLTNNTRYSIGLSKLKGTHELLVMLWARG